MRNNGSLIISKNKQRLNNRFIRNIKSQIFWLFYYGGKTLNKQECKRYFRRAYKRIIANNKDLTISNIENEMNNVINEQKEEYIAYSKIATYNMLMSGNIEITLKDILGQIDVLPKIYTKNHAFIRANKL